MDTNKPITETINGRDRQISVDEMVDALQAWLKFDRRERAKYKMFLDRGMNDPDIRAFLVNLPQSEIMRVVPAMVDEAISIPAPQYDDELELYTEATALGIRADRLARWRRIIPILKLPQETIAERLGVSLETIKGDIKDMKAREFITPQFTP